MNVRENASQLASEMLYVEENSHWKELDESLIERSSRVETIKNGNGKGKGKEVLVLSDDDDDVIIMDSRATGNQSSLSSLTHSTAPHLSKFTPSSTSMPAVEESDPEPETDCEEEDVTMRVVKPTEPKPSALLIDSVMAAASESDQEPETDVE
jgi:hypothetical protein